MKRINIGLIGVGGRGMLAKYMHNPKKGFYVSKGIDTRKEACIRFKEEVNKDFESVNDYDEILNDKSIDAVCIATPDYLHEEMAVRAMKANKHVFLEKPLAITIEGCDRVLKTQKETKMKLMIGFNMRHMPMYRTMKQIIESNKLGEIKAIWVRHFVGRGGDFYFHDWHAKKENTTSLLLQKGCHDIDVIHYLANSYTKKVVAFGSRDYFGGDMDNSLSCDNCNDSDNCIEYNESERRLKCAFRKEIDVEDNQNLIMTLENGVQASYLQCHFTPDYQRNYVVIGTKGRMENFELENKIVVRTRDSNSIDSFSDVTYNLKPTLGSHGGGDVKIAQDFLDMLRDDVMPLSDPYSGRMSVAVGVLAAKSIRCGGKVMYL